MMCTIYATIPAGSLKYRPRRQKPVCQKIVLEFQKYERWLHKSAKQYCLAMTPLSGHWKHIELCFVSCLCWALKFQCHA